MEKTYLLYSKARTNLTGSQNTHNFIDEIEATNVNSTIVELFSEAKGYSISVKHQCSPKIAPTSWHTFANSKQKASYYLSKSYQLVENATYRELVYCHYLKSYAATSRPHTIILTTITTTTTTIIANTFNSTVANNTATTYTAISTRTAATGTTNTITTASSNTSTTHYKSPKKVEANYQISHQSIP